MKTTCKQQREKRLTQNSNIRSPEGIWNKRRLNSTLNGFYWSGRGPVSRVSNLCSLLMRMWRINKFHKQNQFLLWNTRQLLLNRKWEKRTQWLMHAVKLGTRKCAKIFYLTFLWKFVNSLRSSIWWNKNVYHYYYIIIISNQS